MAEIDHAIVAVLVVKDKKFLLVQENRPGREGLYNLPGGHVEAHETLFEAALREVKEEAGYVVDLTGVVGIYQSIFEKLNVSGPVFSAVVTGGKAVSSSEHKESIWVSANELIAMAKDGKLFTKYPPFAVNHFLTRGEYPLDIVASYDNR